MEKTEQTLVMDRTPVMGRIDTGPKLKIPEVRAHVACHCYQKNKNQDQTIQQKSFSAGKKGTIHANMHNIVFVMEGSLRISTYYAHEGMRVGREDLFFLPLGAKFSYEALESGSLMIFSFDKAVQDIPECHTFRFQRNNKQHDAKPLPEIYPLQANKRILAFMNCTIATERDGLKCSNYANLLVAQLMVLIQVYYTQGDYTRFYSAILSGDVEFSDFIYNNWKQMSTSRQLADGLHMTERQFIERFRRTFGDTPGSWLQQRKRCSIYQDLCSSIQTLKDVAFDYGFSMPNFVRYCRDNYGQSPGAIRKQLQAQGSAQLLAAE